MATRKTTAKRAKGTKKKGPSRSAAPAGKAPGIGRSAITGRFMSVRAAKAHSRTAIVEGAGGAKRKH